MVNVMFQIKIQSVQGIDANLFLLRIIITDAQCSGHRIECEGKECKMEREKIAKGEEERQASRLEEKKKIYIYIHSI